MKKRYYNPVYLIYFNLEEKLNQLASRIDRLLDRIGLGVETSADDLLQTLGMIPSDHSMRHAVLNDLRRLAIICVYKRTKKTEQRRQLVSLILGVGSWRNAVVQLEKKTLSLYDQRNPRHTLLHGYAVNNPIVHEYLIVLSQYSSIEIAPAFSQLIETIQHVYRKEKEPEASEKVVNQLTGSKDSLKRFRERLLKPLKHLSDGAIRIENGTILLDSHSLNALLRAEVPVTSFYDVLLKAYKDYLREKDQYHEWLQGQTIWISVYALYEYMIAKKLIPETVKFNEFYEQVRRLAKTYAHILLEEHPLYGPEESAIIAILGRKQY